MSINRLLVALISGGLGHRRGLRDLQTRAARADVAERLRILDHALMWRLTKTTNYRPDG